MKTFTSFSERENYIENLYKNSGYGAVQTQLDNEDKAVRDIYPEYLTVTNSSSAARALLTQTERILNDAIRNDGRRGWEGALEEAEQAVSKAKSFVNEAEAAEKRFRGTKRYKILDALMKVKKEGFDKVSNEWVRSGARKKISEKYDFRKLYK